MSESTSEPVTPDEMTPTEAELIAEASPHADEVADFIPGEAELETFGEVDGEGDYDGIVPRPVTDEDPLVEGEVPEGMTVTPIEGDPVPSNWQAHNFDREEEAGSIGMAPTVADMTPEQLEKWRAGFPDEGAQTHPLSTSVGNPLPLPVYSDEEPDGPDETYKPTEEELAAYEDEKYPPHELDLPPAPEDPAPHAPFDPSHGAR